MLFYSARIYTNASTNISLFLLAQLILHKVIHVIVFQNCQGSTTNNLIKDFILSVLDKIEHAFSATHRTFHLQTERLSDPLLYCQKIRSKKKSPPEPKMS